jgi:hypothetical protein
MDSAGRVAGFLRRTGSMRCVLAVSAAFLLITSLEVREAGANPALLAAKAAQAASRAAQLGRAANAASKMSKMSKMGRIGSRAMRRVMSGRGMGGGVMKPNVLRLRMRKALQKRGLRNFQRMAGERNKKNLRNLMRNRMQSMRTGAKNFAQKQINKRMMRVNRLTKDRQFAMRKMQSLQRRNRAQANNQDAQRRSTMRSHASEMRRRGAQRGVFATAMSHSLGAD